MKLAGRKVLYFSCGDEAQDTARALCEGMDCETVSALLPSHLFEELSKAPDDIGLVVMNPEMPLPCPHPEQYPQMEDYYAEGYRILAQISADYPDLPVIILGTEVHHFANMQTLGLERQRLWKLSLGAKSAPERIVAAVQSLP